VRLTLIVSLSLTGAQALAQTVPSGDAALFAARLDSNRVVARRTLMPFRSPNAQKFAPLASAILPGGGQYMLGNERFIGYVAVEALSWLQYAKNVREQAAREREYKSLAREVARSAFAAGNPDLLPDGDWAYYEKMIDYPESGSYSLTTGSLSPETDPATYNGSRWVLAQSTFSTRDAALAEYMRTAVRPEFEWSWTNNNLAFDRFVRGANKRNDAARAGQLNLMLIGANHAISMIDAFATLRLRVSSDGAGGTSIGATVRW
jgi:hypothetical protein